MVKNPPTSAGEVQVLSLVQEDPTCCGATKPVRYNYRSCALEPEATTTKPTHLEPVLCNGRSYRNESLPAHLENSRHSNAGPAQPKTNK